MINNEITLDAALRRLKDIELALNESSIVAITDEKGAITYVNELFCKLSKYSKEELIGKDHRIVNSGYHGKAFFKDMWKTLGKGEVWRGNVKNKAKDGAFYWVSTTIVPFLNEKGKPYQYISIRHDITHEKQMEEDIKTMEYFDSLTSLPNRNHIKKWVDIFLKQQMDEKQISVLFLDINQFKSTNDFFGHNVGDELLKEVSKRIKSCLSKDDVIFRHGGDEFVMFLPNTETKEKVLQVIDTISDAFYAPFFIQNHSLFVSASIGISMETFIPNKANSQYFFERLIKYAENAMQEAKETDGMSYCFNTPRQNSKMERIHLLEQELQTALENKEFSVVYQPLVDLNSSDIIGAEALLRWHNKNLGHISPVEFIPILEKTGLIIPVGNWVIRTVCNQIKTWQDNGLFLDKVSVNVSPIQFRKDTFIGRVRDILEETELEAKFLELEITESTILDKNQALKTLHALKNLGLRISIDDFGTGYSSLSYLKHLPIDTLKIDKSFMDELDKDGKMIVNTIIHMAKNLNFTVVAEGIEHESQVSYLKQQSCHTGQGYYFSKPIKPEEFPFSGIKKEV